MKIHHHQEYFKGFGPMVPKNSPKRTSKNILSSGINVCLPKVTNLKLATLILLYPFRFGGLNFCFHYLTIVLSIFSLRISFLSDQRYVLNISCVISKRSCTCEKKHLYQSKEVCVCACMRVF